MLRRAAFVSAAWSVLSGASSRAASARGFHCIGPSTIPDPVGGRDDDRNNGTVPDHTQPGDKVKDCHAAPPPRPCHPASVTSTRRSLRRAVPQSGSMSGSSVCSLKLAPGRARATARRMPSRSLAPISSFAECQPRAAATYTRPDVWWRISILNVAGMGKFSSDRTTKQYAHEIWGARPVEVKRP